MPTNDTLSRPGSSSVLGFGHRRIDEYFGAWAILPGHGEALRQLAERLDIRVHVAAQEAATLADEGEAAASAPTPGDSVARFGERRGETLSDDGIALIQITGTMMKFVGSMSGGTSTVAARQIVRRAKADPAVQRVMVIIDSPGGTIAGTEDLGNDIRALANEKPTAVFADSLMASAALWVGAQGRFISAGSTALIGSIGGLMAVADYSQYAASKGIVVHVITSDGAEEFKGAGIEGSKVTDRQIAEFKRVLNGLAGHFFEAVASGRGMSLEQVKGLADGRVHLAADAQRLGLIDHVESFDAAMNRLRATPTGARAKRPMRAETPIEIVTASGEAAGATDAEAPSQRPENTGAELANGANMPNASDTTSAAGTNQAPTESKAATMAELKAGLPGAVSDFLVEQAVKGANLAEAKDAFLHFQAAQIRDRDSQIAELKNKPTATAPTEAAKSEPEPATRKAAGVKAVASAAAETKAEEESDAVAVFEQRVKALTDAGMSRAKAASKVFGDDDQLRDDYRDAKNRK